MADRQRAFFVPGPLHLFRSGGMYFAYELARTFDLVLVLDENYRADPTAQKFLVAAPVAEIVYLPPRLGTFARHSLYSRLFSEMVGRHRPRVIVQHNSIYLWNMYLFYFASQSASPCLRAVYLTGQGFIVADDSVRLARMEQIDAIARRYRVSQRLAAPIFTVRTWLYFAIHHRLLPLLYIGRSLLPRENYLTAAFEWPERKENFDVTFVTHERNVEYVEAHRLQACTELVAHPSLTVGEELHAALYGRLGDGRGIVVLPSNAYAITLMRDRNWSRTEAVAHFSALWAEAIARLRDRFAGYRLLWKLHPSSADDPLMLAITDGVRDRIPELDVRPVRDSAELLALANNIVVSDVSTILYWSRNISGLVPISLDVFGVRGGGDMKAYDGIAYIDDLSALDTLALQPSHSSERLPTFGDTLGTRLAKQDVSSKF